ncbi:Uncharacterised protein [Salmonella enterica subsp. enterica serovar Typhi]|nr:Uncharacterised protein [Salmonella enterica subsp. enterica serovar Typhi]
MTSLCDIETISNIVSMVNFCFCYEGEYESLTLVCYSRNDKGAYAPCFAILIKSFITLNISQFRFKGFQLVFNFSNHIHKRINLVFFTVVFNML